ncbi:transposase-like protein [Salinibacter ruber]|nr:transposase-like protein [Salinibacter ruber]MCS3654960.1 transposase-like protein [Salinibacter ruber]
MLAVGVSEEGQWEILGLETAFGETQEAWRRFIDGLKRRGLSSARVATSDAHDGLKQALKGTFPGLIWQRCHTEESLGVHFRRNVLGRTPSGYRDRMHQVLDQLLEASSQRDAQRRLDEVRGELEENASAALEVLEGGLVDATAVLALPDKYRRRLRTTNMLERFIEEIRRREKVIRIFPNIDSAYRLVGALCAETHEEWPVGRRYLRMDEFFEWKTAHAVEDALDEEPSLNGEPATRSAAVPA